ncbi:DUF1295 domain-containing protein [Flagellimonas olearia]|uniref:DUF1295 domain-containing protein n=1 Tax=Flagellimonas olearia TaxID=552546 RepID=A0A6I1EAS0_9FLAO|nr:isoprenylcysteine carboxylmethyltransferase family protein [Allomuricauda olearia]KAB7530844.1 DUF1295 domain-containing protein [Allomuricauda olearia]
MALQEEFEQQGIWLFRYRSFLPLVIIAIGIGLYINTEIHPETFFIKDTPYEMHYELFCLFVGLLGQLIRIFTIGHTPKNTSGRNVKGQVADTLNTTGIYSVVRHPLYLGNFFMWLGPALLTGNFWFVTAFCFLFWVYYERIMFAEEQFLRKKFGMTYLHWSERVPAFIPNFKQYRQPIMTFSWKKVLKQEKNGLFNLFIIFFAFDMTGELINGTTNFNLTFLIGFVLASIGFLILTFLKRRTAVLNEENTLR